MNKDSIFARTGLGNDLLDNPKGRISGDELLLMALIDGHTSIGGITKKVPPSVQVHLEAIFTRLLSAGIIEETGSGASPEAGGDVAAGSVPQTEPAAKPVKSRENLERELASLSAQLEATKARQKEVEVGFHKLRLHVSAYTEIRYAKLTKKLRELETKAMTPSELRASYLNELNDALDSLGPLDQLISEQQKMLDTTLRLRVYQGGKSAEQLQKEQQEEAAKMASSHPYYKKLRGLDFFKGFANAELLQFLDIAKWQEASAGDTVLSEGDVGMPFFIIVSGEVVVSKGNHFLARLVHGDFFGEFAYLSGEEPYRTARVDAETACEFLVIDPLDIEFAPVQLRLHVVEALLRGQVRRTLVSSKPIDSSPIGG